MTPIKLLSTFIITIYVCGCISTKSQSNPKKQEPPKTNIHKVAIDKEKHFETKDIKQNSPSNNTIIKKLHFVFFPGLGQEYETYFNSIEKSLKKKYDKLGVDVKFYYMGKIKTKQNENYSSIKMKIKNRATIIAQEEFVKILKNKKDEDIVSVFAHSQGGITLLNSLNYLKYKKKINLDNKISYIHFAAVPFGGSISSTFLLYPIWNLVVIFAVLTSPVYFIATLIYSILKGTWKINNFYPFTLMKCIYAKVINAPVNSIFHTNGANDLSNFFGYWFGFWHSDVINTASETFKNIKKIIPNVKVNLIRAETDIVVPKKESFGKKLKFPINKIVDKKITIKNLELLCAHTGCITDEQTWQFITNEIDQDYFLK